ncbi:dUTP diphosphatase [Patescibacteria group bacterium]|nr:dUTP diphosphatase [Patescibacteria group bacterium]
MKLLVKKLDARAKVPSYVHPYDAGLDLFALEDYVVPAGQRLTDIRTGIAMVIPEGYVGLCWDKSGLAAKAGLKVMAGVIDSGFRGELKLVVFNTSNQDYTFKAGEKVMQILIQPVLSVEVEEVEDLDDTSRGQGSWGSTGK